MKYAVRLRNYGSRTANGDGGMTTVQCSDGVTFTFSTCSLSSNGTNQTRGQIPQVLYYRLDICVLLDIFAVYRGQVTGQQIHHLIFFVKIVLLFSITEVNMMEICSPSS